MGGDGDMQRWKTLSKKVVPGQCGPLSSTSGERGRMAKTIFT